ncbi:tetratricopeptide repeat protein 33 [Carcharodon carcharias]|uniref:tetratricopeptide repeat protein 33 n=1 Tax=Carcharodon carcharias TaxID=13397 RepID=UPI001B7DD7A5|nr:tetratricopeptide repeat protein 33 [Carcharodon carcharias]
MKAQVLKILNEVFQAVQAAEMAVRLNPQWWEALQTLGRAQLSLGEITMAHPLVHQALRSFQTALHMCPNESSLWEDDLAWALELRRKQQEVGEEVTAERRVQRQEPGRQLPDYDFESDELVEACAAIAERDRRPAVTRTSIFITASQGTECVTETAGRPRQGDQNFIQAR